MAYDNENGWGILLRQLALQSQNLQNILLKTIISTNIKSLWDFILKVLEAWSFTNTPLLKRLQFLVFTLQVCIHYLNFIKNQVIGRNVRVNKTDLKIFHSRCILSCFTCLCFGFMLTSNTSFWIRFIVSRNKSKITRRLHSKTICCINLNTVF